MSTKELINSYIENNGLKMAKKLQSSSYTFFGGHTEAVYDSRSANSLKDVFKLTKEGFTVDENVDILLFNALVKDDKPPEKEEQ